jgi:hypothetical protein
MFWSIAALVAVVLGVPGLFWLCHRLLRKAQGGDRRYGNPDHWQGAGDHW